MYRIRNSHKVKLALRIVGANAGRCGLPLTVEMESSLERTLTGKMVEMWAMTMEDKPATYRNERGDKECEMKCNSKVCIGLRLPYGRKGNIFRCIGNCGILFTNKECKIDKWISW